MSAGGAVIEATGHTIEVANLDKELYPGDGITKGEVLDYYCGVANTMVSHLHDRPLTMRRFPDGIGRNGFFQQQASDYFPNWLQTASVSLRTKDERINHVVCQDDASVLYLANQACLEFHMWLSTVDNIENPNLLVIDLDPPKNTDIRDLREVVHRTCGLFEEVGLTPFVQTTGGHGFHVVAPLDKQSSYALVRPLARDLAQLLQTAVPDLVTIEQRKENRGKRIYLDINRNAYGQTMVAPYSLRARPGAPVATPIRLDEIDHVTPGQYTIRTIQRRLADNADPWADLTKHAVPASTIQERLEHPNTDT